MWIYDSADNTLHLWSVPQPVSGSQAYCGHQYNPQTCTKAGNSQSNGYCPTCYADAEEQEDA